MDYAKKAYNKSFKWIMLILILISVAALVLGFIKTFTAAEGQMTDVLLYWTYAMVAIAAISVIFIAGAIGIANNPKVIVKWLILAAIIVAVVALTYFLLAKGSKVDTILYLTYIAAGATILSIVVGEIIAKVRS